MKLTRRALMFPLLAIMVAAPIVAATAGEKVKQIDAKFACFITMKKFDKALDATVVDGKKYYGCCSDCVKTLNQDSKSRMAVDPVSKKEVDKALAIVGADKDGNIYFFENDVNLKAFRTPAP